MKYKFYKNQYLVNKFETKTSFKKNSELFDHDTLSLIK